MEGAVVGEIPIHFYYWYLFKFINASLIYLLAACFFVVVIVLSDPSDEQVRPRLANIH